MAGMVLARPSVKLKNPSLAVNIPCYKNVLGLLRDERAQPTTSRLSHPALPRSTQHNVVVRKKRPQKRPQKRKNTLVQKNKGMTFLEMGDDSK